MEHDRDEAIARGLVPGPKPDRLPEGWCHACGQAPCRFRHQAAVKEKPDGR